MTTATDTSIQDLLTNAKSIALLGVSPRPDTKSYDVATYLQSQGYELVPITDGDDSIVGYKTAASLADVNKPVDLLAVFLNSNQPISLVDDVTRLGIKAIWVEPGCSPVVKQACEQTPVPVLTNRSISDDHQRLLGNAKV